MNPLVERKALNLGEPGRRWLDELPRLVTDLERRWSITVGEPLDGGTASFTARARTADGAPAVVKIAVPSDDVAAEIRTLRDARGHGYARLLDADPARHAVLLEALGPSLQQAGLAPEAQIEVLCRTLRQAWRVPRPPGSTVHPKARELATSIVATGERFDRPCPERVVERAVEFAERRGAATEPVVVVHGDPHPENALQRPGGGYVLVDPDGFVADPTYDLGVVLRDWCPQLLAGDAVAIALGYCRLLADHTRLGEATIWEWGFLERVSTGLYLLDLGAETLARPFLDTVNLLVRVAE